MDFDKAKNDVTEKNKRLLQLFKAVEIALAIIFIYELYMGNIITAAGISVVIVLCVMVYVLAKQGETILAGNILLLIVSIMMLSFMWLYEGIRDEVLLIFPAIIMFSIYIGSRKFTFFIYFIVCINIFAIAYLNEYGFIINKVSGSTLGSATVIIVILSVLGYSVSLISKDLLKANQILTNNKLLLEEQVQKRTTELQASIEQLTNTQTKLIEAEKMASLGRLVAGVAHEINTPLGIAITAISHLEIETNHFNEKFQANEVSKKNLQTQIETSITSTQLILSNLQRAAELVQSFKEVAVDQSEDKKRQFDLKHYLEEILTSLTPKIKNTHINLELSCPDNLSIFSSPGAIAQIITNLFMNALTHAFEHQQQGIISINVRQKYEVVTVIFADNGIGIPEGNLEQIFEPFFTTKRGSGGSGLGMHIVYNLVHQSLGGSIKCHSTLGEGSKFTIQFPYK